MHWTCTKISASAAIPDATLLEILLDKVSFSVVYVLVVISQKTIMILRIFHSTQHILSSTYSVGLLLRIGSDS